MCCLFKKLNRKTYKFVVAAVRQIKDIRGPDEQASKTCSSVNTVPSAQQSPAQAGAAPWQSATSRRTTLGTSTLNKSLLSLQVYFSAQEETESIFCTLIRAVWVWVSFEGCSCYFKSTRVFPSWGKRLHRSCEEARARLSQRM